MSFVSLRIFTTSLPLVAVLVTNLAFANSLDTPPAVSRESAQYIAQRIWQNEGNQQDKYLTHWNKNETFASMGIGHFIWYPASVTERPYKESFPELLGYLQNQGIALPDGLSADSSNPWSNRDAFFNDFDSPKMAALRALLARTHTEQALFIAERFKLALPRMLATAPSVQHQHIRERFNALLASPQGLYALMDYTNFKGEGTHPSERYQGEGWGLLQALLKMPAESEQPLYDFVTATDFVLTQRVALAPKDESRWLPGWRKRLQSYLQP
ncbi:MAG: hypothetical protein ACPGMR_12605 [Pontibacterium sp.]